MAGKVEKVSIQFQIDPFQEMDKSTRDWCILRPALKKKLKPIPFSEKAEVDTRKWPADEIEEELRAHARMDLKIFDVAVLDQIKAVDKARDREKGLADAEKKISSYYDKLSKDIERKLLRALDEIKGGDDDTKAFAEGKAALKKLEDVDLELVFKEVAHGAAAALRAIHAKVDTEALKGGEGKDGKDGKGGKDQAKAEKDMAKAYLECAKRLSELSKQLKSNGEEAKAAIEFLQKTGKKISRNKKFSDEMNAFGAMIVRYKPTFDKYVSAVVGFQGSLEAYIAEVKLEDITEREASAMAKAIEPQTEGAKAAREVNAAFRDLSRTFKALEKQLA